jgi:hypothetical protein
MDFGVDEPDAVNRSFEKYIRPTCCENHGILVVAFTGEGLSGGGVYLTSAGSIVERLNHKGYQYVLCQQHEIPVAPFAMLQNFAHVRWRHEALLKQWGAYVLKIPGLSGGYRMASIGSTKDLAHYEAQVTDHEESLVACALVNCRQSFSGMGCVYEDGAVSFFGANEQLLNNKFQYMGLIYPAFLNNTLLEQIKVITNKSGKMLHSEGYRGFFNVDLMLSEDRCLLVAEINARFGFSTLLFGCMYQERCFDVLLDRAMSTPVAVRERIIIVKTKGKVGKIYQGLQSHGNIIDFYNGQSSFENFYCGENISQRYVYGSFIGLAGMRFALNESREHIVSQTEVLYHGS